MTNQFSNVGGGTAKPDIGGTVEARQHGGPIHAGRAYWTGEAGRELIVPDTSGWVFPHDLSEKIAMGAAGGRSATNAPTVNNT